MEIMTCIYGRIKRIQLQYEPPLQSSVNASCGLLERNLTLPNQECMQRYTMAAERRCKPKTEFLGMMIGKAMAGTATESSVCSAMRRLVKCHIKVVTKKCDEEFANFIKNTLVDSLSKAMPGISCSVPNSTT